VSRAVPAKVSWADGKLAVTADNSSLNQILREIGRLTGMTVTGGVAEQRVFGQYGPGPPAQILGDLLEGTGSNMILRETSSGLAELILSPRVGGVTPPNPNAPGFDDAGTVAAPSGNGNADPASLNQVPPVPAPRPPYNPPPSTSIPNGYPGGAPTDATTPPPTTPSPSSPTGALTPAQIYQQLQQLQKTQPQP
jgi:hypothetical protein